MLAGQIVLTQLHRRVGISPRPRIGESHRLHRPEPQRVAAAVRHHLDRKAALEELLLLEILHRRRLRVNQRVIEARVFLRVHRAIQIISLPIVHPARRRAWHRLVLDGSIRRGRREPIGSMSIPPRCAKHLRAIDRLGQHDRADRVVEIEVIAADEARDVARQRVGRERPRRDDHGLPVSLGCLWDARDLVADDGD